MLQSGRLNDFMNAAHITRLFRFPLHARTGSLRLGIVVLTFIALCSPSHGAEDPIGHWVFQSNRQQSTKKFVGLAGQSGRIVGNPLFSNDPPPVRMTLRGDGSRLVLAEGATSSISLPKEALSVAAWVQIDRPLRWGGILSAVQDNGSDESGWVLGFQNSQFSFAIATEKAQRLTYLAGKTEFETGRWYHVVGTYDGENQRLYVNGSLEAESHEQGGAISYPERLFYEIGAYHDQNEDYPMKGAIHEIQLFDRALAGSEIQTAYESKQARFPEPAPAPEWLVPLAGPYVDWMDRRTARVTWEGDRPMPTKIELHHPDGEVRQITKLEPARSHSLVIEDLDPKVEYEYRILGPNKGDQTVMSKLYRFDATFYYTATKDLPELSAIRSNADASELAQQILGDTGVSQGYCVVVGAQDGSLALELVRESDLEVIVIDPDAATIQRVRETLDAAGVYGVRASAHHVATDRLPFGTYLANLIVSESLAFHGKQPKVGFDEIFRILRPTGGILYLGSNQARPELRAELRSWVPSPYQSQVKFNQNQGTWMALRRSGLAGAGDWSHQYASPDNSSCSKDELVTGDLGVLWWGDPGPRPMPDRGGRNPAPLSVNGRLYVQGNRILFGMDAYNGTVLWSKSVPEIRRANVPRDSSNMVASDQFLYVVQGSYCLGINGQHGQIVKQFPASGHSETAPRNWGYLATVEDQLIGTSMKPGPRYTGDDGEWFEDFTPSEVSRVTSSRIFGLDRQDGTERWIYEEGVIINSTITIADNMIFFLESHGSEALNAKTNVIEPDQLTEVQLVCLDLDSGQVKWQRAHDFSKCEFMVYMSYGNDTLVVTGTDRDKVFHTYAFNTKQVEGTAQTELEPINVAGSLLWSESHKEDKGHHSGHLQHPLIIGDTFFSDQRAFSLRDGKLIRTDLPERRGCGTMSAAQNSVFFRHYFHGQWDLDTDKRTQFEGLRSGCWLGMIPAGGLLLAPEASAGCSCANAIQTSIGYIPRSMDPTHFPTNP